ncbi:MAG: hypothetical protein LBL26_09635 [Peptococcaceae bacterium]|nr:hypothetical protein [Peptococcaceae bacterium]
MKLVWNAVRGKTRNLIQDERGDLVATLGWMAVTVVILVLVHGLITGWLPGFVNQIFSSMDSLI